MLKNNAKYFTLLLVFIVLSCAKRGNITGGAKDTIAPTLKMSFPKNFTTNFTGTEIKLTFDEYIKLKDIKKQLIISPPLKNEPEILPSTVSKFITIKINDTLQKNTTYSFNFGQSIADNNEGNPYNQFKYVFSTGSYIDSLALGGRIKDAYSKQVESFVSILLYEANDKLKDSVVYTTPPKYITNTLDSLKTFRLENLKAGKYLLVALKDYNNNNKFNAKTDKIAFHKEYVTIPNDTVYELELFKEVLPFKAYKPSQASGNRMLLGYDGKQDFSKNKPKITLTNKGQIIPSIVTQMAKKDSLQVWFSPLKTDSLAVQVEKENYKTNFTLKIKDQKKDSLSFTPVQVGNLNFREQFTIETVTPLIRIDSTKISLKNKALQPIKYKTVYDELNQKLFFDFKKEASETYTFELLPGALTDYLDRKNDSLSYKVNTRSEADFGNLTITLLNAKRYPIIVELTNKEGKVQATEITDQNTSILFSLLEPAVYSVRAIYDDNKNGIWDTGNYLEKRQAEELIYFSKEIDVRANWEVEQPFDLSIPYVEEPKPKKTKEKPKSKF